MEIIPGFWVYTLWRMHRQCVPAPHFEPGNEANAL